MPKSLITGGAGFIGSHITDYLVKQGHQVVIVDNLSTGSKKNVNPGAKFYKADIQDRKISKIFEKERPDFVFHLAAQIDVGKSVKCPILDTEINVLGSLNILENSAKYNIKKFMFASTGAVYGDAEVLPTPEGCCESPLSPYGANKLSVEKDLFFYKKVKNMDYVILRLANVYGPRQNSKGEAGVIAIFIDKILKGEQLIINGDGNQTRDYVFINDVIRAFMLAYQNKTEANIFNIGTGAETSVNQVLDKIIKYIQIETSVKHGDARQGEPRKSCLDYRRANKELGWLPECCIDEGIEETVRWFKEMRSF